MEKASVLSVSWDGTPIAQAFVNPYVAIVSSYQELRLAMMATILWEMDVMNANTLATLLALIAPWGCA